MKRRLEGVPGDGHPFLFGGEKVLIKDSKYFLFGNGNNQQSSSDFGITHIVISDGIQEEPFGIKRTIKETKVHGSSPLFNGFDNSPLEFSVNLYFENGFDEDMLNDVAAWLFQDDYQPLIFDGNPDRIYYVVFQGDSKLSHIKNNGFLTLNVRSRDEFVYTPEYISQVYDLSVNVSEGTQIIFTNKSWIDCKPEFWIQKVGDGEVSIINNSDGGKEVKLSNLVDGETVYVNNESRRIVSDLPLTYHYDDLLEKRYLLIPYGENRLKIKGRCYLWFRYHFKLYA